MRHANMDCAVDRILGEKDSAWKANLDAKCFIFVMHIIYTTCSYNFSAIICSSCLILILYLH